MRSCFKYFIGSLIAVVASSAAQGMEPGEYQGKGENAQMSVTVKGKSFSVYIARMGDPDKLDGCQGDAQGLLRQVKKNHWKVLAKMDGISDGCMIDIRQKVGKFFIQETNCFPFHGATCSFNGVVSR